MGAALQSALNATPDDIGDLTFQVGAAPGDTYTAVAVAIGRNGVALYRSAGDPIAVSPSGNVAVKLSDTQGDLGPGLAAVRTALAGF